MLRSSQAHCLGSARPPIPSTPRLRHDHHMSSRPGTKTYTVASTAPRTAIDAAHASQRGCEDSLYCLSRRLRRLPGGHAASGRSRCRPREDPDHVSNTPGVLTCGVPGSGATRSYNVTFTPSSTRGHLAVDVRCHAPSAAPAPTAPGGDVCHDTRSRRFTWLAGRRLLTAR